MARQPSPHDALATLTPREADVLRELTLGATNAEAALHLGCGERTIEKHLEHVYAKLGVSGRLAAVRAFEAAQRRP
jgi:DNA-binding CsgD family transcriptional regulator